MANFYKMTLYVCDLGENLSIENIKYLIDERALDGISVSCLTHYTDEKVGKQIEWHDDIDINYSKSTDEQWENYF